MPYTLDKGFLLTSIRRHSHHPHFIAEGVLLDNCFQKLIGNGPFEVWNGSDKITVQRQTSSHTGWSEYDESSKQWGHVFDYEPMNMNDLDFVRDSGSNKMSLVLQSELAECPRFLSVAPGKSMGAAKIVVELGVTKYADIADCKAFIGLNRSRFAFITDKNPSYEKWSRIADEQSISAEIYLPVEWGEASFGALRILSIKGSQAECLLYSSALGIISEGMILQRQTGWKYEKSSFTIKTVVGKVLHQE